MCEPVYALFIIHSFQQSIQQLTSKYRLQVCNKVHELTKLQIHVLSVERHLRNDFLEICKVDGRQDVLEEALYMLHQLDFVQIEHEKEEKVTFYCPKLHSPPIQSTPLKVLQQLSIWKKTKFEDRGGALVRYNAKYDNKDLVSYRLEFFVEEDIKLGKEGHQKHGYVFQGYEDITADTDFLVDRLELLKTKLNTKLTKEQLLAFLCYVVNANSLYWLKFSKISNLEHREARKQVFKHFKKLKRI